MQVRFQTYCSLLGFRGPGAGAVNFDIPYRHIFYLLVFIIASSKPSILVSVCFIDESSRKYKQTANIYNTISQKQKAIEESGLHDYL